VIRDARDDERDRVAELTRRAYEEFADVMEPRAWKAFARAMNSALEDRGTGQCIVADDDGRLVGSVFLYAGGTSAYGNENDRLEAPEFRLLAVAPNTRGRGIGRALVEECIRRAKASGAHELGLHTSKSFAAAIAMYEAMGFTRVPERDFQPEGAELVEGYRLAI
jgi:ribosomal protein S18 acetylase RimI-like enzyme